jgi:hypothetical protein
MSVTLRETQPTQQDDSFIDMVYECYMTQLAHGASQKTAPA